MLSIAEEEYLHPSQVDTTTVYTLAELRAILLPLVRGRGMRDARIFGSYARGEADGNSDIDLVVDKGENRFLAVSGLAGDIYEITGKLADVYDFAELRDGPFKDRVLREAVTL